MHYFLNSLPKHLREYSYSHSTGEYIEALRGWVMPSRLHASKWQSVIQTQALWVQSQHFTPWWLWIPWLSIHETRVCPSPQNNWCHAMKRLTRLRLLKTSAGQVSHNPNHIQYWHTGKNMISTFQREVWYWAVHNQLSSKWLSNWVLKHLYKV